MKQNEWIDVAKGIGILLVIIGHSPFNPTIINIIFTFHMPLFFFMGGYLFNYSKYKKNTILFVSKKAKRLVYPFFITNIIVITFLYYFIKFHNSPIKNWIGIIYGNSAPLNPPNIFTNIVNVPSWYLLSLFCSFIILYIIAYSFEKYGLLYSIFLCCFFTLIGFTISKFVFLPWGLDIAFVSMIFMFSGYLANKYVFMPKIQIKNYIFIILIFFIVIEINGRVDMNTRLYKNLLLFIIGGLLGTYLTIDLSKRINRKESFLFRSLTYLGKNSIIILLYHAVTPWIILETIPNNYINIKEIIYNSGFLYFLNALIVSIFTIMIIKRMPLLKDVY